MSKASTTINTLSNTVNNLPSSALNDILRLIVEALDALDEDIKNLERKPQR